MSSDGPQDGALSASTGPSTSMATEEATKLKGAADAGGEGAAAGQKPDAANYNKRKRNRALRNAARGVLVTATHSNDGIKDAIFLLQRYVSPPPAAEDAGARDSSVTAAAPEDVADVEGQVAKRRKVAADAASKLTPMTKFIKGVNFVQFSANALSPNLAVMAAMDDLLPSTTEGGKFKRRFHTKCLQRILPVEIAASPHPAQFRRIARALVEAYFPDSAVNQKPEDFKSFADNVPRKEKEEKENVSHQAKKGEATTAVLVESDLEEDSTSHAGDSPIAPVDAEGGTNEGSYTTKQQPRDNAPVSVQAAFQVPKGSTWCCIMERRTGMKTLDRLWVAESFGSLIGHANYKVNLTAAEFVILVEVNKHFCGLSVVQNYFTRQRLNFGVASNLQKERRAANAAAAPSSAAAEPTTADTGGAAPESTGPSDTAHGNATAGV